MGLTSFPFQPFTNRDMLEYDGVYYVVGSSRQVVSVDKTNTDDFYLLTLAAVAKEIAFRKAERTAAVHLAVGLPIIASDYAMTSYERDRQKFQEYLLRDKAPVQYRYEKQDYCITIQEVSLFPQDCGVILPGYGLRELRSAIIMDIGGRTVNLMRVKNLIPERDSCQCLTEQGTIRCFLDIQEQIQRIFGHSVTEAQIESVLRREYSGVPEQFLKVIRQQAVSFARNLFSSVRERGMEIDKLPVLLLGGGASLLRPWIPADVRLFKPVFLPDTLLNAKSYERLAQWQKEQSQQEKTGQ